MGTDSGTAERAPHPGPSRPPSGAKSRTGTAERPPARERPPCAMASAAALRALTRRGPMTLAEAGPGTENERLGVVRLSMLRNPLILKVSPATPVPSAPEPCPDTATPRPHLGDPGEGGGWGVIVVAGSFTAEKFSLKSG